MKSNSKKMSFIVHGSLKQCENRFPMGFTLLAGSYALAVADIPGTQGKLWVLVPEKEQVASPTKNGSYMQLLQFMFLTLVDALNSRI